jgi:hypothetical protein
MRRFFAVPPAFVFLCLGLAFAARASAQEKAQPLKLTLTTIAVPGVAVTEINGINSAGDMVGFYGQNTLDSLSGFLYSNGVFTYFDYPGQQITVPGGINDSGLIVGLATQDAGQRTTVVGFLYDGANFTTLQDGSYPVTNAYGINNADSVVGSAGPDLSVWAGFAEKNGRYRPVRLPGEFCPYKAAYGINNLGEIVGATYCGLDNYGYAVLSGKVRSVQFPGSTQTTALGVNDKGVVVGWYGTGGLEYAFAYMEGKYISFSYPSVKYTFASGINKSGQIVGSYSNDNQTYYGFVSSPITPADFARPGCCQTAIVDGQ